MKRVSFYLVSFFLILCSCSPSVSVTSSWKNVEELASRQKSYNKVFISALTNNQGAKATVESALADAATKRGYVAVKSIDLFGGFNMKDVQDKDLIKSKIKGAGCDAVFTVALIDKESETRYTPGTTTTMVYAPYPRLGYYGTYGGYSSYWYGSSMYSTPGYYTTDKTYFLESNLYDTESEKIIWSAQSKTVNPSNLQSFSEKYTAAIVERLERDGLLKK